MKNGGKIKLCAMLALAALVLLPAGNALAKVGGACVSCHTMHNSQGGTDMMRDSDSMTPNKALVRAGSCFGCHGDTTVTNGSWDTDFRTPRVNAPAGEMLAGGSFSWVELADNDAKGHNVKDVAPGLDGASFGLTPPGWNATFTDHDGGKIAGGAAAWASQLTCAGTVGCHGLHEDGDGAVTDEFVAVKGAHHDDSKLGYRMLNGIAGLEDSDWEITKAANDHNQYKGSIGTQDKTTISYLCSECHGNFHTASTATSGEDGSAPWLRHPTDFDMNGHTGEYKDYNGDKSYSVVAPVASTDVSAVKSAVLVTAGDAIVTCLSCHRPHGSANDDLLRWAYNVTDTTMAAKSDAGNTGCFICHTTKDDL